MTGRFFAVLAFCLAAQPATLPAALPGKPDSFPAAGRAAGSSPSPPSFSPAVSETALALLPEATAIVRPGHGPLAPPAQQSVSALMRALPYAIAGLWLFLLTRGAASAVRMQGSDLAVVGGALVGYMAGNVALVIIVTTLVSSSGGHPFPIMVSNLEMMGSFITAAVLGHSGVMPLKAPVTTSLLMRAVLPVAVAGSFARAAESMSYSYLGLPLTQMLHPMILVWTLGLTVYFGLETLTWGLGTSVALIVAGTVGTALGSYSYAEVMATASLAVGFSCAFVAHLSLASKATATQLSLQRMCFIDSIYWCNLSMSVMGLVAAAVFEPSGFAAVMAPGFPAGLVVAAMAAGSVVTFSSWILVQRMGAMTLKVLSAMRGLLIICVSWGFFEDTLTAFSYAAYAVSVVGMGAYHETKTSTMRKLGDVGGEKGQTVYGTV